MEHFEMHKEKLEEVVDELDKHGPMIFYNLERIKRPIGTFTKNDLALIDELSGLTEFLNNFSKIEKYNFKPLFLDSSKTETGLHIHTIELPSMMISFMPYASEEQVEAKKNKQFALNNPKINRKITLTNIMKLKTRLAEKFLMSSDNGA